MRGSSAESARRSASVQSESFIDAPCAVEYGVTPLIMANPKRALLESAVRERRLGDVVSAEFDFAREPGVARAQFGSVRTDLDLLFCASGGASGVIDRQRKPTPSHPCCYKSSGSRCATDAGS